MTTYMKCLLRESFYVGITCAVLGGGNFLWGIIGALGYALFITTTIWVLST